MNDFPREAEWQAWMRAAVAGDAQAYRRFLEAVTPFLRGLARRRCERFGAPASDAEDIVQETLLAIHLKRSSWDMTRPIVPWIATIARNKLIDALRRNGRGTRVPIEEIIDTLEAPEAVATFESGEIDRLLGGLKERERDIVRSISFEARGMRETASRLGISEGALRVALHRALKTLAALYRSQDK